MSAKRIYFVYPESASVILRFMGKTGLGEVSNLELQFLGVDRESCKGWTAAQVITSMFPSSSPEIRYTLDQLWDIAQRRGYEGAKDILDLEIRTRPFIHVEEVLGYKFYFRRKITAEILPSLNLKKNAPEFLDWARKEFPGADDRTIENIAIQAKYDHLEFCRLMQQPVLDDCM